MSLFDRMTEGLRPIRRRIPARTVGGKTCPPGHKMVFGRCRPVRMADVEVVDQIVESDPNNPPGKTIVSGKLKQWWFARKTGTPVRVIKLDKPFMSYTYFVAVPKWGQYYTAREFKGFVEKFVGQ
jgi:hypothetical protein